MKSHKQLNLMNVKKIISTVTMVLIAGSMSSCKKNDIDELQEAQYCLNKAPESEARACVNKISSQNTAGAYKLMCASVFISKGFGSPTSFAAAIDSLSGSSNQAGCSGGECSPTLNAMNVLNFGTDTAAADEAVNFCTKSSVVAYSQLSSMFSIGTLMKVALGATTNPTPADLEAAIVTMDAGTLGGIVVATYSSSCADLTNASDATKKYCAELQVAISATGGSNAAIGACLKYKMDNPSATACP